MAQVCCFPFQRGPQLANVADVSNTGTRCILRVHVTSLRCRKCKVAPLAPLDIRQPTSDTLLRTGALRSSMSQDASEFESAWCLTQSYSMIHHEMLARNAKFKVVNALECSSDSRPSQTSHHAACFYARFKILCLELPPMHKRSLYQLS